MNEGGGADRPRSSRRIDELSAEVRQLRGAVRARELLLEERERQLADKTELVTGMLASRSWRLTRPLRAASQLGRRASAVVRGRRSATRRLMETMFDADWYSKTYGIVGNRLLEDYLSRGWREGRNPMPLFDSAWYVAEYADRPADTSPLEDFVEHPFARRPNRWFDPTIWRRTPARPGSDVVTYLGELASAHDDPRLGGEDAGNAVVHVSPGSRELEDGCAACVFVHYDADGRVDPHVLSTLAALFRAGRRIVVCSTSPVSDEDSARLGDHVAYVLSVPNSGYDWGAYHAGLGFVLARCAPASVTLMNDSVYVIAEALESFLERADRSNGDVVGATDSLMFRYHLQSYFLLLQRSALASALTSEFLQAYVPVSDKHYVINSYEIGFSRRAMEHRLMLDPVFPLEDLITDPPMEFGSELAPNSTLDFWETLLERGFPFVKAQLLRDLQPDRQRVEELVPRETLRLAYAHLERTGSNIAGGGTEELARRRA
jgi:hypothetical protein